MANFASILLGISSFVAGMRSLSDGLNDVGENVAKVGESLGKLNKALPRRPKRSISEASRGALPGEPAGPPPLGEPRVTRKNTRSIEDNARYIVRMIQKGRQDPRVRIFAAQAVSRKCGPERNLGEDAAGNGQWCLPEKDHLGEVRITYKAVLDALYEHARERVRYLRDTYGTDLYQSPARILQTGAGDCFPVGTLVVTRDGLEEIQNLQIGDEIHDGEKWVRILQMWVRGPKEIIRADLNNGCSLRLSGNHKILRVPRNGNTNGRYEDAEEIRMEDLRVNDDLLQPRRFDAASNVELDPDDAFLIGAYLAEGWKDKYHPNRISIAGIVGSKMVRENIISILEKRGAKYRTNEKQVDFDSEWFPKLDLGRIASEKHLPTFRFGPKTISAILHAMEMGDGGVSTSGTNMVYSTISRELAIQYRVLQRMMGRSTSISCVVDHGGFGKHPIYRVTVRNEEDGVVRRPWAKVKSISVEDEMVECVDVMTESGKVYLPESDVITHNCDDYVILLGSALQSIGYPIKLRIVQTNKSPSWDHIYLLAGIPPRAPTKWVSLDASLAAFAGWEVPKQMLVKKKDFVVP